MNENTHSADSSAGADQPFLIDGSGLDGFPMYESLAEVGVEANSNMPKIRLAMQNAQRTNFTTQVRRDFEKLMKAPQRLVGDLFYVHTDPSLFEADAGSASGLDDRPANSAGEEDR